jgi:hypothetical protein
MIFVSLHKRCGVVSFQSPVSSDDRADGCQSSVDQGLADMPPWQLEIG